MTNVNDVADASRLVAFGLRPTMKSTASQEYSALVRRYRDDESFRETVLAICTGFDLAVLGADDPYGIVVGSIEDSAFAIKMSDYAKRASAQGPERVLHGLAFLGVAAMAFPRPADLASPTWVGRVSVLGVERFVREACERLDEAEREHAEQAGRPPSDIPSDRPDLMEAWRAYSRRTSAARTAEGRLTSQSTAGIVRRALVFFTQQGLLRQRNDAEGGTYSTTPRFTVQVRDAAGRMFGELISLGIAEVSDGRGSLVRLEWTEQDLGLF